MAGPITEAEVTDATDTGTFRITVPGVRLSGTEVKGTEVMGTGTLRITVPGVRLSAAAVR